MALLLSVHPDRQADLITPDTITTRPEVALAEELDLFGNRVTRLVAPPGLITFQRRFRDPRQRRARRAGLVPSQPGPDRRVADRGFALPAGQPLLRDRQDERARLVAVRRDTGGVGPGAGHRRLRP